MKDAVQLTETKLKLFGFIGNRWYFKRFIEPGPKISMSKEVHSQQGHEIRKGPIKLGSKLEETENQHCDQCCPNLDLDGIGTGTHKGLDLKVSAGRPDDRRARRTAGGR